MKWPSFKFFNKLPKWVKTILIYLFLLIQIISWILVYKSLGVYQLVPIKYYILGSKIFCLTSLFFVFYYIIYEVYI
jgi:hypothetical protein